METIIYEHQNILDKDIINSIHKNRYLHKYFISDFDGIKATSYCGYLKVDNKDILILPKISKNRDKDLKIFMFMILYSHNIENINDFDYKNNNLYKVFLDIFANNLLEIINRTGLYKEYISTKDSNSFLKGKLVLKDYILNKDLNNKFSCEYDEFSTNHKLNQSLFYAIKNLKQFAENKSIFIKLEKRFSEIDSIYNENINFNHLNIRFKESYNLAKFLLRNLTKGKVKNSKSFSFMFNMDILFEDFIGKLFKEVLNAKLQKIGYFGNLKLEPDIIIDNLIIDLKYKVFKNSSKKDDKYQMYIYGNNFEIKNTMLLYPRHLQNVNEKLQLGNNKHKIFMSAKTVDLSSELDYKEYILEMKKRVIEIVKDYND